MEALLAGFGAIDELGMAGGLGEVEDAAFLGDGADQPFAHRQAGDVDRFLAQAVGGEQLELVVAQQIDRADLALHRLGDQVDDAVELGLGVAARRHHVVKPGQDLAGGSGGGLAGIALRSRYQMGRRGANPPSAGGAGSDAAGSR